MLFRSSACLGPLPVRPLPTSSTSHPSSPRSDDSCCVPSSHNPDHRSSSCSRCLSTCLARTEWLSRSQLKRIRITIMIHACSSTSNSYRTPASSSLYPHRARDIAATIVDGPRSATLPDISTGFSVQRTPTILHRSSGVSGRRPPYHNITGPRANTGPSQRRWARLLKRPGASSPNSPSRV